MSRLLWWESGSGKLALLASRKAGRQAALRSACLLSGCPARVPSLDAMRVLKKEGYAVFLTSAPEISLLQACRFATSRLGRNRLLVCDFCVSSHLHSMVVSVPLWHTSVCVWLEFDLLPFSSRSDWFGASSKHILARRNKFESLSN